MPLLRYAAKFDRFLSLDCARVEGVVAQSKGRDHILPSGNLAELSMVVLRHDEDGKTTEKIGRRDGPWTVSFLVGLT